ncbi:PadR family transcriptional regulator PadR [Sphingobacterium zeae]|uniref:PadR family transcriptional regulator PadR n=3 Tax=Sphingobacterium TaxID=28453 RepID=A0ABU0U0L7_9SPHI|nr:PadR family transcriptional regulator PadR [Sphingobacterium zeae]
MSVSQSFAYFYCFGWYYVLHGTIKYIYLCIVMIAENTQIQMRKGILEYCILSIISRGEIYASDIISELKKAQLLVVEGTLYPLLTRLKNNGLLSYIWKESTSGPPRKYYEITQEGLQVLSRLDVTWNELVFAVNTSLVGRNNDSKPVKDNNDE